MRSQILAPRREDHKYIRSIFAPSVYHTWFILLAADFLSRRTHGKMWALRRALPPTNSGRATIRFQRGHVDQVGRQEKMWALSPFLFLSFRPFWVLRARSQTQTRVKPFFPPWKFRESLSRYRTIGFQLFFLGFTARFCHQSENSNRWIYSGFEKIEDSRMRFLCKYIYEKDGFLLMYL